MKTRRNQKSGVITFSYTEEELAKLTVPSRVNELENRVKKLEEMVDRLTEVILYKNPK